MKFLFCSSSRTMRLACPTVAPFYPRNLQLGLNLMDCSVMTSVTYTGSKGGETSTTIHDRNPVLESAQMKVAHYSHVTIMESIGINSSHCNPIRTPLKYQRLSLYSIHTKYQPIGSKTVFINLFIGIIELQN